MRLLLEKHDNELCKQYIETREGKQIFSIEISTPD